MKWIDIAKSYIGTKEIHGTSTAPQITKWLQRLRAWWSDDETPWCGVFVANCFTEADIAIPKNYMRALEWAKWGVALAKPVPGCVVVFSRLGGGHVGFVLGRNKNGMLHVLGGNQGDAVSMALFDPNRVVAYRWPDGVPVPAGGLPTVDVQGALSRNEA